MKIDINDDFETVFQNEAFAGFTVKQCIAAGAGLAAGFGSALALWHFTGLPPVQSTYVVVPVMVPFCALGFFHLSGEIPDKTVKGDMVCPQDRAPVLSGGRAARKEQAGVHYETMHTKRTGKEESPWPYLMRTSGSGTRNG